MRSLLRREWPKPRTQAHWKYVPACDRETSA
jgi:hypothetical protein